jgi:hypothetical protein
MFPNLWRRVTSTSIERYLHYHIITCATFSGDCDGNRVYVITMASGLTIQVCAAHLNFVSQHAELDEFPIWVDTV